MGESKQFRTLTGFLIKLTKHTEVLYTVQVFDPAGNCIYNRPVGYADQAEGLYKMLCTVGVSGNGHANQQFK
jgi:hypothetical protein